MTYPTWGVLTARNLAYFAHTGQTDKVGRLYIRHPARVVIHLDSDPAFAALSQHEQEVALMVGWLHDVLEDTAVTSYMLYELGCPEEVDNRVRLLTRPKVTTEEGTARYYRNIAADPIALLVKKADIADNTDPTRLALLDWETRDRLTKKYAKARAALGLEIA